MEGLASAVYYRKKKKKKKKKKALAANQREVLISFGLMLKEPDSIYSNFSFSIFWKLWYQEKAHIFS